MMVGTPSISASRRARCNRSSCKGWPPTRSFNLPAPRVRSAPAMNFASFLPPDGSVKLSWKTAAPEAEGNFSTPPRCFADQRWSGDS
jgi:hypothetical protein